MLANLIIYDIGSTFTKLTALNYDCGINFVGRTQSPTTIENIEIGFENAKKNLIDKGIKISSDAKTFCTSSAAGGLRMVAFGYMPRVTSKAAKEVSMNAGARVLEILSNEDSSEFKSEVLMEIKPDIILLAGGTDGGDETSITENAKIISKFGGDAVVIIAGNKNASQKIKEIFNEHNKCYHLVSNVMPNIHNLNVKPSRDAIHNEFIKQITKAKGLEKLINIISNKKIIPTPGAVLLAAELISMGTFTHDGEGSLIVIDLGGATTDIHSVVPEFEELSIEEKGLVINNEKQPVYRTVEGNLGMRVSATGIVEAIGAKAVLKKQNIEVEEGLIEEYAEFLEKNPEHIAQNDLEKKFDMALASSAIEIALKRHAGFIADEFNPVLGIIPGVPIGRDLRLVKNVIAVGGIFTHSDEETTINILNSAFSDIGISLLPDKPNFIIDKNYIMYTVGVLSENFKDESFIFAKKLLKL